MSVFIASLPQLKDLHNIITPNYAARWRAIGTQLGLKNGLLDTIDYNHPRNAENCCNAVFEEWLDNDHMASWNKIIEAVESPAVVSSATFIRAMPVPQDDSICTALTTATTKLQKSYIHQRYTVSKDDWPSYQPEHFTSVALIHHVHKHVTTKEVIAVAKVMHKGNIADNGSPKMMQYLSDADTYLSSCKSTKNISEIFYSPGKHNSSSNVVLIEGAPGIGKTILAKEIAFQWAKNEILRGKKLLFLIFLCDPQLSYIKSLEQFICYAMNWSSKNKYVEAIQQYIENTAGECCTIIFDGYDEVSEEIRSNSFISKIIFRKILSLCSLVITSRPTATAELHDFVDRRVEILGFTKEDRTKYIHQSLEENAKEIKFIQEFLEKNPFIDSLCYIPLNMTILICLFKSSLESGTELPKSQTEINNKFAIITIVRHLKKEKHLQVTLDSLFSLPSPYKQKFKNLSKMAHVFLGKDKLVFNDEDIRIHCPKCVGKWDGLGLLKVVKHKNIFPTSSFVCYNFLHFSMQEFLAGFYISTLKDAKQNKILQEIFWNPRYHNAGIMYVGLVRGDSFALKHFLSGQRSIMLSWLFGTKGIAQNTFSDKVKCLHLFQCFLEAGNDEIAHRAGNFLSDNTIDFSGHILLQKDIHSFGFFLTKSVNKVWYKLNLSRCYIGDQGFEILCRTIHPCMWPK